MAGNSIIAEVVCVIEACKTATVTLGQCVFPLPCCVRILDCKREIYIAVFETGVDGTSTPLE